MAENIGKVIVSIEAKVEELERGLAKAEATMKRSADKMAAEQKKLTTRFSKSWTELSNKISALSQLTNIFARSMEVAGKISAIAMDDTLSGSLKVADSLLAIGDAGIPIASDLVKGAEMLAGAWTGATAEISKYNLQAQKFNTMTASVQMLVDLKLYTVNLREVLKDEELRTKIIKNQQRGVHSVTEQYALQRRAVERGFKKEINIQEGLMGAHTKAFMEYRKEAEEQQRLILQHLDERYGIQLAHANTLSLQRTQDAVNARLAAKVEHEKELQDRINAEQTASNYIARAKMDLVTRIAILEAEAKGDTEKAQLIALDARIKKEKEAAIVLGKKTGAPSAKAEELEKEKVRDSGSDVRSSLFESEMQKVADQYDQKIKDLARQLIALGATEGQGAETKAKRAELSARHVAMIQEKSAKQSELIAKGVDPAVIAAEIAKVEAKYKSLRAERSKATKEQLALIDKVAALEIAAITKKDEPADTPKGGVATIQTAFGAFTVGVQHEAVTAKQSVKQTTLLQAIASASPTTATAATKQVTLLQKANGWLAKITDKEVETSTDAGVESVVNVEPVIEPVIDVESVVQVDPMVVVKPDIKAEVETKDLSVFTDLVKKIAERQDVGSLYLKEIVEPSEGAFADSEVKIVDLVNVSIPEKQIALLADIADKTHDKEQMKVLEKIAASSAKVAQSLSSPTASGIIIAS